MTRAPKPKTPRPRNATATREAILASARRAFARAGYDGAGVREIAAGAGVTAMLVNRYFGSKEQLFAEAISAANAQPIILTAANLKSGDLAATIAEKLVEITKSGDTPLDGFLIMLHSASSKRAAELGREEIEKGHQKTMAGALAGDLAPQRAALILSIVAGFQVMRQMIGLSALADARPEDLTALLTPLFRSLIDAKAGGEPSGAATKSRRSSAGRRAATT
ncbi:TetR/AcrR family transcriptional regulator [Terrarubrum flagellatum]|uniref:TetR/AcrR family transcriptional regulator n=1 Tax=Terrirubrum flagellatum TaxID=2895980 RepID=UPI003144E6E3